MSIDIIIVVEVAVVVAFTFLIGYGCKSFVCTDNTANYISEVEEEIDNIVKNNNEHIEDRALEIAQSMQMNAQLNAQLNAQIDEPIVAVVVPSAPVEAQTVKTTITEPYYYA